MQKTYDIIDKNKHCTCWEMGQQKSEKALIIEGFSVVGVFFVFSAFAVEITLLKGCLNMKKAASTTTTTVPRMMTIRQVAATGVLPEYTIRAMVKDGSAPFIMRGNKALINFDKLVRMLEEC